jgi:threonine dehydratase
MMLGLRDIERARARIDGRVHLTPVMSATSLGDELGVRLRLKAELFQKTGSFKPRGVFSKLLAMERAELARGLVSLSAGNHAAALAYGATAAGTKATIVMPATAVRSKVEATMRYGGEVVQTDGSLLDTCLAVQAERRLTLVHPFDDLDVMAGQGTVGLEILQQVPDVGTVIVPVGGGGLISGVAAAIKLQRPSVRVVGVEPHGADAMCRSLERGTPVHLDKIETIADGLAAPFAGEHTMRHVRRFVDEMVRVGDAEIAGALALLMQRCKLAAEPSGAAGLAALVSGAVTAEVGSTVVIIVSGGNVGPDVLAQLL